MTSPHSIALGIVPTHLGFLTALVPDEQGRLPRNAAGELVVTAGIREILNLSATPLQVVQISAFAKTTKEDTDELITAIRKLQLEPQLVMMLGDVNPMDPADEDATIAQLHHNLEAAIRHDITQVNSTSVEAWMSSTAPATDKEYQARVHQIIKVHTRAYHEAGLANSCVQSWNIEFLRPGEFHTFTSLAKLRPVISGLNAELGSPFFKILVDAAHCGDSDLSLAENKQLIAELAAADELGPFHSSAKTTRGAFSSDEGWIQELLTAAASTGKLRQVLVEIFRHDDPALQPLRELDPGHGIDTTAGQSYPELVVEGLELSARWLR